MLASESIKVCDDAVPPLIILQRDTKAVNTCAADDLGEISGGEIICTILSMRSAVAEVRLSFSEHYAAAALGKQAVQSRGGLCSCHSSKATMWATCAHICAEPVHPVPDQRIQAYGAASVDLIIVKGQACEARTPWCS